MNKKIAAITAAVASVFCATAFLTSAYAQTGAPVANPSGILRSLSFDDISPILTELGYTTEQVNQNGQTALVVRSADGRTMLFKETVCRQPGTCAGLWMIAIINDTASTDMVNNFNSQARTTRASVQEGVVFLDRYLIADYGTARGSFAVNATVFKNVIDLWFQFTSQSRGTANTISFNATQDGYRPEIDAETRAFLDAVIADGSFGNGSKIAN